MTITQPTGIDPDPAGRIPYRVQDRVHGWTWSTAWPTAVPGLYVREYRTATVDDWDDNPYITTRYQIATARGLVIPFRHPDRAVVIAAAEALAAALPDVDWLTVEKLDPAQVEVAIDTLRGAGLVRT